MRRTKKIKSVNRKYKTVLWTWSAVQGVSCSQAAARLFLMFCVEENKATLQYFYFENVVAASCGCSLTFSQFRTAAALVRLQLLWAGWSTLTALRWVESCLLYSLLQLLVLLQMQISSTDQAIEDQRFRTFSFDSCEHCPSLYRSQLDRCFWKDFFLNNYWSIRNVCSFFVTS